MILKSSIPLVREKLRREAAIKWLEETGHIKIVKEGTSKMIVIDSKDKEDNFIICNE